MKVNKKKFEDAIRYLIEIEKHDLDNLDLSEFGETSVSEINKFKFTGLNNRTFITWKWEVGE